MNMISSTRNAPVPVLSSSRIPGEDSSALRLGKEVPINELATHEGVAGG